MLLAQLRAETDRYANALDRWSYIGRTDNVGYTTPPTPAFHAGKQLAAGRLMRDLFRGLGPIVKAAETSYDAAMDAADEIRKAS
jgi:hypothetical protein